MTSRRPYLLRGLYQWIVENGLTPYILVNAKLPDVHVPQGYVQDGRIVLNISPEAAYDLLINNITLEFHASFSGLSRHIIVPINAIEAIYAQENGQGQVFNYEPGEDTPPDNSRYNTKQNSAKKKPHLKIVKE